MNAQAPFVGAIMTHPLRTSLERYHRRWWPGWTRVMDDGCGLVENFCRTLEAARDLAQDSGQPWAMMVNDDARPVPHLVRALPFILSQCPTHVVSFISFRYRKDVQSLEKGERFRIRRPGELIYTIAMAFDLRVLHVEEAVAHIRAGGSKHDDVRFAAFVDAKELTVSTHIPSLVEHVRSEQSLLGNPPTIMGHPRTGVTFPDGLNIKEVLERYPYTEDQP